MRMRGHAVFHVVFKLIQAPSCIVAHIKLTKKQRSIAFLFREGSGLMTSQLRPLQFSTHCKILAKCLKFSYFVASDVWLLTPCGVTLCLSVPPCQTSQALENAKTHCAQSRPWLRVNQILEICPVNKE